MNEPMTSRSEDLISDDEPFHDLFFGVRRSVRYHLRRRSFFETLNTLSTASALIFGSATLASLLGPEKAWAWLAPWIAVLVTVISAINLVVGSPRKAQLHWDLARKFIALEKQLVATSRPASPAKLAEFTACRLDIESDEPPVLRVLDTMCHNDLMRAMGYESSQFIRIGRIQRMCANLFDWREHTLVPKSIDGNAKTRS